MSQAGGGGGKGWVPGPQPRRRGSLWPGGHEPGTGPGGRGARLQLGTPAPALLAWGPAVSVGTSAFPSAKWDHSTHFTGCTWNSAQLAADAQRVDAKC